MKLTISLLALATCNVIVAAPAETHLLIDKQANFRGNYTLDNLELHDDLTVGSPRFTLLSDNWMVTYQRSLIYRVTTDSDNIYSIYLLSEYERLGFAIIDSNSYRVLGVGEEEERRQYRKLLSLKLKSGQPYFLVVGSGSHDPNIPFSICSFAGRNQKHDLLTLPLQESLPLGKVKGVLTESSSHFEGKPAVYYSISHLFGNKDWLSIKAESDSGDPVLYGLSEWNRVVRWKDDIEPTNRNARIVIGRDDECKSIVLASVRQLKKDGSMPFQMNVSTHLFNPEEGLSGFFSWLLKNPILAFSLGGILSFCISWFFFHFSLQSRSLVYEETLDHTIIAEKDPSSPLRITVGQDHVKCASLYKFRIRNSGRSRIDCSYVKEPLTLTLSSIDKILDIDFNSEGKGWKLPSVTSNSSVVFDFSFIDPRDWFEVVLICRQPPDIEDLSISYQFTGSISETRIKPVTHRASLLMTIIDGFFGLLILALAPLILIDIKFDIMPLWFGRLFTTVWPILMVPLIIYYVGSKIGRQRLVNTVHVVTKGIPALIRGRW